MLYSRFTRHGGRNIPAKGYASGSAAHFTTSYAAMNETTSAPRRTAAPAGGRLGDRLRLLRVSVGLTQTELAGERFSKEYVSQIERGKTRPTAETIE